MKSVVKKDGGSSVAVEPRCEAGKEVAEPLNYFSNAIARVETDVRNRTLHAMAEIVFDVREDEVDGGDIAAALGHNIFTEGDTLETLRANVRAAVQCHFGDGVPGRLPGMIRLHFGRDEVFVP